MKRSLELTHDTHAAAPALALRPPTRAAAPRSRRTSSRRRSHELQAVDAGDEEVLATLHLTTRESGPCKERGLAGNGHLVVGATQSWGPSSTSWSLPRPNGLPR